MDDRERQSPFYERRWFKATVAVVGLLTAVWAFTELPKPGKILNQLTAEAELPLTNTEIVLDRSRAMRKPFGDGSKLQAATGAVAKFAASTVDSGLGLRVTGGGCLGEGDVRVGLGASHDDEVQAAVVGLKARGPSNVVGTVRRAIDEFNSDERFHGAARRGGSWSSWAAKTAAPKPREPKFATSSKARG